MKIENIFCDICGYKFKKDEYWSLQPCRVRLILESPPRQRDESSTWEHLCFDCVESIKLAVEEVGTKQGIKNIVQS